MTEKKPDPEAKLTAFGEPLWLDALKTAGVAAATLLVMILIGVLLGLMIVAPWGRATFDCSMYCVIERELAGYFADRD